MSRILVTGGAGYIGSVATALLCDRGEDVIVFDDLSTGYRDAVDIRAEFVVGSLLDLQALDAVVAGSDAVIHFAGKSLVGESVEKPDLYHHVNVDGSKNLLSAMKSHGVQKLVFSSSAATYGESLEDPITELSQTAPTNPYGQTKLEVDKAISTSGVTAVSLRYFNVAGAFARGSTWLAERHNPETHLIPNMLRATQMQPLKIFGTDWQTRDGTCVRDYVHVVDLIEAHLLALSALENMNPGEHQIVNIGSGRGYSVREVVTAAESVLGRTVPVVNSPRRAGDPETLVASISKASTLLGWAPTRKLETMVADTAKSLGL
jgi:UDP-glucose 4-epimerase